MRCQWGGVVLQSGKYDAVISNIAVTEAPNRSSTIPATVLICSASTSTNQDQILREWDRQNIPAGLKLEEYRYFEDAVVGRLAVITGCGDVSFEPNATGAYSARDGKVRRVGLFPGAWP